MAESENDAVASLLADADASTSSAGTVDSNEDDGVTLAELLTKKIALSNGDSMYRIYSAQCRPLLAYRGFIFYRKKQAKRTGEITWRCVNRHKRKGPLTCNAKMVTSWAVTELLFVGKSHNEMCTSDEQAVRLRGALNDIKISAEFWSGTLADLYREFDSTTTLIPMRWFSLIVSVGSLLRTDADLVPLFPSLLDKSLMKSLSAHRSSRPFRKEFQTIKSAQQKRDAALAAARTSSSSPSLSSTFPETICCECGESVETQENLVAHLRTAHGNEIVKIENFRFGDRLTASQWLRHLHTCSKGSLTSLTLKPVRGVIYHLCSLDERIKGADCTGIHCPAFVKVSTLNGGHVPTVEFCLSHSFHGDDKANADAMLTDPSSFFLEQMNQRNLSEQQHRLWTTKRPISLSCTSAVVEQNSDDVHPELEPEEHLERSPSPDVIKTSVPSGSSATAEPLNLARVTNKSPTRLTSEVFWSQSRTLRNTIAEIDVDCKLILKGSKQMLSVDIAQKCAQLLKEARNLMVQDPSFDQPSDSDAMSRDSPPPKRFKHAHLS